MCTRARVAGVLLGICLAAAATAHAQGPLSNGNTHSGDISSAGEIDTWTFSASLGNTISISAGEIGADSPFYPWIRLRRPDGVEIASNYGALVAQVDVTAPLSGTYTVLVASADTGNNDTGDYTITLALSPADFTVPAGDEGGPMTNGANYSGHIFTGDLDLWSFTAAKGDTLSVSIGEVLTSEIDPGFFPWVRLRGPDGQQLGSGYGTLTGWVDVVAPLSGTYTVVVGTADTGRDASGDYVLTLARSPAAFTVPTGDDGGPLANGTNNHGHIHVGDLDQWSFTAAKGDSLHVSIGEVLTSEVDPGFFPWIRLRAPDGLQIGSSYGTWVGAIDTTAPLSGTYTVVVGTADTGRDAAGDYVLTLAKGPGTFTVPEHDEGGPLTNGANHTGHIGIGDLDMWSFAADKGDTISLSAGEVLDSEVDPGFFPWVRVIGPDGADLGSGYGTWVGFVDLTAPLTGTYTVIVSTADTGRDATGDYTLTLAQTPEPFVVPAGDNGGPMTNGVDHGGTIFVGDLDQWTFPAIAGSSVTVTMTEPPPGETDPGFYPWIRIRRPDGVQIASNYGPVVAQANFLAPLTGTYTVVAGTADTGRDATGTYTIRVDGAGGPGSTTFTVTPSAGPGGSITPSTPQVVASGATASFTVTPAAGFQVQAVGGTCGGSLVGNLFTTAPVSGNCTVAATFRALTSLPEMTLDKSALHYAAVTSGTTFLQQTGAQVVRLLQSGTGPVTWTATPSQPWLTVSPASGVGPAELSIGVLSGAGVPTVGTVTGAVTLAFGGSSTSPLAIDVSLTTLSVGTTDSPFGFVDTPADFSTGISGAVPFTGWGLDDVQVDAVVICRAAVSFEGPVVDARCGTPGQVFIGQAVFIDRARPDVEAAFPGYPLASRGGWGFMVLTNMLPDIPRGLPTGGNGTFTFYMYARDVEGHLFRLDTRTLTCDNDHAVLPFGAIDTPGQGDVIAGSAYVNFGWALTQNPKMIPVDGSTIHVYVDGNTLGTVNYNHFRSDIATFFPGLANSNGAVGFRVLDTTTLPNGLHTIAWGVADSAGQFTGIGSRFFTVANSGSAMTAAAPADPLALPASSSAETYGELPMRTAEPAVPAAEAAAVHVASVDAAPLDARPIAGRRGWNPDEPLHDYTAGSTGRVVVRGEELDRFELFVARDAGDSLAGYLRTSSGLAPLPAGSHLDESTGVFTWAPGAGFVGRYDLVFLRSRGGTPVARQDVRIQLAARGSNRHGPQVVIDRPGPQQDVGQPFVVAGWAADLNAAMGSGIATVHVWAYPHAGGSPVFLGVADRGANRPDVAATYGAQFAGTGYSLTVAGLAPGIYDLAVFAWSESLGDFAPAATVQVIVRP